MDYNARLAASITVTLNLLGFSGMTAITHEAPSIFVGGVIWTAIALLFIWLKFKGK